MPYYGQYQQQPPSTYQQVAGLAGAVNAGKLGHVLAGDPTTEYRLGAAGQIAQRQLDDRYAAMGVDPAAAASMQMLGGLSGTGGTTASSRSRSKIDPAALMGMLGDSGLPASGPQTIVNPFVEKKLHDGQIDEHQAEIAAQVAAARQARIGEGLRERRIVEKEASKSWRTQDQIDDMWQQHKANYPEMANQPAPKSREQQMAEARAAKLESFRQQMPGVPVDYNAKGEVHIMPGYVEMQRAKSSAMVSADTAARSSAKAKFDSSMKILHATEPVPPAKDADPNTVEAYRRANNLHQIKVRAAGQQYEQELAGPPAPEPVAPPAGSPPPPFEAVRQKANTVGLATVADQADYDALPHGTRFIDASDGLTYEK